MKTLTIYFADDGCAIDSNGTEMRISRLDICLNTLLKISNKTTVWILN